MTLSTSLRIFYLIFKDNFFLVSCVVGTPYSYYKPIISYARLRFRYFFFTKLCGDAGCAVLHLAKIHSPTVFIKLSLLHVFINNFLRMHKNSKI